MDSVMTQEAEEAIHSTYAVSGFSQAKSTAQGPSQEICGHSGSTKDCLPAGPGKEMGLTSATILCPNTTPPGSTVPPVSFDLTLKAAPRGRNSAPHFQ